MTSRPHAAALTNSDGDAPTCADQSPRLILSRISRSRVAASGMRSSASARHISAMPSRLSSENSSISASTPPAFERSARTACGERRGQRLRPRELRPATRRASSSSAARPSRSSARWADAMRSRRGARASCSGSRTRAMPRSKAGPGREVTSGCQSCPTSGARMRPGTSARF